MAGEDFQWQYRVTRRAQKRAIKGLTALSISPDDQVIPVYYLIAVLMAKPIFDFRGMQSLNQEYFSARIVDQAAGEFSACKIATAHQISELKVPLDVADSRW